MCRNRKWRNRRWFRALLTPQAHRIGKRAWLGVRLSLFITNNLYAAHAPEMLGAIRTKGNYPGVPSAVNLHRSQS